MKESVVVGGSLLLAILIAGAAALLTGSHMTFFAGTPVGFAVYLVVGVGLPQSLLSRESGAPTQRGLAVLSVVTGVLIVLGSLAVGSPTGEWGAGLSLLFFVVIGNVLGAIGREFRAGYRSGS